MINIEITNKFARLKSVSSIDDDYFDYSFTSAVYLSLYNYKEKQWSLFRCGKSSLKLDYVIEWRMFLKGMSKSLKYTWWSLMYRF